jgi:hypothetical protein
MPRICPVYAPYLLRYGTSMEHVRNIPGASTYLGSLGHIFFQALSILKCLIRPKSGRINLDGNGH